MKIWIDFINTPQVTFFIPFIRDFRKDNHDIILTCRNSGNTVDLLRQNELSFHIIGTRAGKGTVQKFIFFTCRLIKLFSFIRNKKPDIAVSQSSFYQPLVARLLKIACLYTNDNEYAKGNIFGFLFASKVTLPVALQNKKFTKQFPLKAKLSFYPSVKEAIYLSQFHELTSLAKGPKNKIYFRPEPWSAQYYKGPINFFDDILIKLSLEHDLIILPRDINQTEHYKQNKFSRIFVSQKPLDLLSIITNCLLFIGAGGSMTREMAVMNVPVISIYQSELLSVDKYLVDKGLLLIKPDITYEEIKSYLNSDIRCENKMTALSEGKESYNLIKNLIYNLQHE